MTAALKATCRRCGRALNRRQAVSTRAGVFCAHHADHLAPYLRRPPRPAKKEESVS